jgi:Flp pilus assembly protein TadG
MKHESAIGGHPLLDEGGRQPFWEAIMRKLLTDQRGSTALATLIAMTPLIGMMALGTESVSWYVTHRHAQHAADTAAYAGALSLACQATTPICSDPQPAETRAQQVATMNGSWTNVTVDQPTPGQMRAAVTQHTKTVFAKLLGINDFDIGATAAATATLLGSPCVLALTGSVNITGTLTAPNCGVASNSTAVNALNVTGTAGFYSTVGGCTGCTAGTPTFINAQPASNPFAQLDTDTGGLTLPACPTNNVTGLTAYTAANACTNNNFVAVRNKTYTLPSGAYFISGNLILQSGSVINGTAGVTFILLPGAGISGSGGTLNITAPTSVSSSWLPSTLQGDASLLQGMAVYSASSLSLSLGTSGTVKGNIYAPTATVTYQGNQTGCSEIVAAAIVLPGNAALDNSGCSPPTKPFVYYAKLTQ